MKQRLSYLFRFYLLTVFVFIVAKVAFMYCNQGVGQFSFGDVPAVVVHGLSLDLSTALYVLSVPLLLTMVGVWVAIPQWVLRCYHLLVAVALALAFVADTSLYGFWHFKLDASWLQYLETPAEAVASVTAGYLVVRVFVLLVVAALLWLAYDKLAGCPRFGRGQWKEVLVYVCLVPVVVVGIRGGVGESTTNIGQVYYSQNQFLNHSAVNPVFSFLYSLSHQLDDLSQYQFFDGEECRQLVDNVFTTESILKDTLLTTTRPNILVVMLESAGEQFAEAMPRLQQLKQQGVYFSHCYANSWRTDRGTVCALSGYPSFPSISVMKIPEKSRTLPSIARTLKSQGYATSYLYGGDINFTNMRSYLIATGWEQLTSMANFTLEQQHTAQWGVRDDITFQTVFDRMMSRQSGTPYLMGYSTLSSHEPWDVPMHRLDDEVLNAFHYLDSCLASFIDRLQATPQWQNLLVVLVADHGVNHGSINPSTPLQKNHIPMLWLGGAVRKPCVVDAVCAQSDLAATLLGQLQLSHADFAFSRDVLSRSYVYPTAFHNYNNAQWLIDSTGHVLYDFDAQRFVVSESSDAQRMLRVSKAILQTTSTDLMNR